MTPPTDAISVAIDADVGTDAPLDRWGRIPELEALAEAAFRNARARVANDLHAEGKSWRAVGELLGVTAQRAHQIANRTR